MNIEQTNRAYRRGLILGWTLAEIFLLILFVLLLAFAGTDLKAQQHIRWEHKRAEGLAQQNDRMRLDLSRQGKMLTELKERQRWIQGLEEAFGQQMKKDNPQAALREMIARSDDADRALKTLRS